MFAHATITFFYVWITEVQTTDSLLDIVYMHLYVCTYVHHRDEHSNEPWQLKHSLELLVQLGDLGFQHAH